LAAFKFWEEEVRGYPHGGKGAALWVVRRNGTEPGTPLTVLFAWSAGTGADLGLEHCPPLGTLLKAMNRRQEELVFKDRDTALWVEPLLDGADVLGCIAVWFQADEPWREGIFLWGQRLAARLGPVMDKLEPLATGRGSCAHLVQPTLFPLRPVRAGKPAPAGVLVLPRPVTVPGIPGCVGVSREMVKLGVNLRDIARSGVNVLLRGESGTGKEVIARALHLASDRNRGPFVGQNCAALPESLFESELFGHRAGAFTGASGEKKGLLASASGGTFFLDEIGDMPLALQIKLLRVMQERRVRRIGELQSREVDIRFVAATHKDLSREIEQQRFRLDLFYRLKVVSLEIPPLRHRPEDVAPLFAFFLGKAGRDPGVVKITEKALRCLQQWRWPGNVRELENEVQRFAALYPHRELITRSCLSPELQSPEGRVVDAADLGVLRELGQANEILERYLIRKAIAATEGRKAAAARRLGLSRQGLYKKIQRYGMTDLIAAGDA
jgi:transcriptional regulator with AAA-type ATPase domain